MIKKQDKEIYKKSLNILITKTQSHFQSNKQIDYTTKFINTLCQWFIDQYHIKNNKQKQWIWQLHQEQQCDKFKFKFQYKIKNQQNKFDLNKIIQQIIFANQIKEGTLKYHNNKNISQTQLYKDSQQIKGNISKNEQQYNQNQIQGYKLISIKHSHLYSSLQSSYYIFNNPIKINTKKSSFKFSKISNQTCLNPQFTRNSRNQFFPDFYQQQIKQQLLIINPNINNLINQNKSFFNDNQYQLNQLNIKTPGTLILTNSNLFTILSLICYQMVFNEVQEKYYKNKNNYKQTKVLTTYKIFRKYLQIMVFLNKIVEKVKQFNNNKTIYYINKLQQQITQFKQSYLQILSTPQYVSQLQTSYKQPFNFITPNQPIQFLNISLNFRSSNIYLYQSYDLQLQLQTLNNQKIKKQSKFIIQGKYLKNVKKIYYHYKNNKLTENQYIQVIKRLEQKQEEDKRYDVDNQYSIKVKNISKLAQVRNQMNKYCIFHLGNDGFNLNLFKDKNNHNNSSKVKITKFYNIKSTKLSKQKLLYHNPYQISHQKRQLFYPQLRNNQNLFLLSDQQIYQILNNSILIEYNYNQIVFNSTMKLEDFYFILRGKAVLINDKNKKNKQQKMLRRNDLFGWDYFLNQFQGQKKQQNNLKKESKLQLKKISILTVRSLQFQNQQIFSESKFCMRIISSKAIILKVPFQYLQFWLFYKKNKLKKFYNEKRD